MSSTGKNMVKGTGKGLPDKISFEEIKEALTRSGYLLESRIEMVLRNEGYWVESNQTYSDPYTNKSREFDLIAQKTLEKDLQHGLRLSLSALLLIECINNSQPVAFITRNKNAILSGADPGIAGYPIQIEVEQRTKPIDEFLGFAGFHHYYKGSSATQYCSFQYKEKQKEWMAWHDNEHHDVFTAIMAVTRQKVEQIKCQPFDPIRKTANLVLYYPIVVFQGELLEVTTRRQGCEVNPADAVQYVRYASLPDGVTLCLAIDVVTEKYFPSHLGIIKKETEITMRNLSWEGTALHKTVEGLLQRARTPDEAYKA